MELRLAPDRFEYKSVKDVIITADTIAGIVITDGTDNKEMQFPG